MDWGTQTPPKGQIFLSALEIVCIVENFFAQKCPNGNFDQFWAAIFFNLVLSPSHRASKQVSSDGGWGVSDTRGSLDMGGRGKCKWKQSKHTKVNTEIVVLEHMGTFTHGVKRNSTFKERTGK